MICRCCRRASIIYPGSIRQRPAGFPHGGKIRVDTCEACMESCAANQVCAQQLMRLYSLNESEMKGVRDTVAAVGLPWGTIASNYAKVRDAMTVDEQAVLRGESDTTPRYIGEFGGLVHPTD